MSNPYTDRMDAIARLRVQKAHIEQQMGDEIAKAWRLMVPQNLETFAATLNMTQADVLDLLAARGITA